MKIINTSDRIYDLGGFQVLPSRRGIVVPKEFEEAAEAAVKKFGDELEFAEARPAQPDPRDAEIARLKAELKASKPKKAEPVKTVDTTVL